MLCQFRTIGAGIGVLAVCFMLASLSWQYVLLGFAIAGISWALWSCSVQLKENDNTPRPRNVQAFERRQRRSRANVYNFPVQPGSAGILGQ